MAKTTVQTSFRIDRELLAAFQHALIDQRKSMSAAVEELIRQWLTQRAGPLNSVGGNRRQGALTPEDVSLVQRLAARMGVLLDQGGPTGLHPSMAVAFLDLLPVVVVIKDPDGRVLWANRHYLQLTGKSLAELKGRTAVDIWGQGHGEEIRKHERLVIAERKGRAFVEEVPIGDLIRLRETLRFPIFDESGSVVSMIGALALDLLQAFRAYEEFSGHPQPGDPASIPYRFLRFLPIPALVVDPDDRVQYANEAYTAALGKGLGEIKGGSLGEYWPAEVAAGMVEENRLVRCGAPTRLALERLRIKGKMHERMCFRFPIPKEAGGPPLVASLGLDFKKIGAAATLLEEIQKGGTAFIPLDAVASQREVGLPRKTPASLSDAFLTSLPAVATVKDTFGRIIYANPAYEKLTGKDVNDVRGQLPTHHWPVDVAELIMSLDRWVRKRGKPMLSVERIPVQGILHNRVTLRFPIFRRVEVEATASLGFDFDYIESRAQRWSEDPVRPNRSGVYSLEDEPLS